MQIKLTCTRKGQERLCNLVPRVLSYPPYGARGAPSHTLKVRVFGTRNGPIGRRSKRYVQKGRFSLKRPIRLDLHNVAERSNCRVRTESLILEKILKFALQFSRFETSLENGDNVCKNGKKSGGFLF